MSDFKCAIQPCMNNYPYQDGMCKYHYLYGGDDKPTTVKAVKKVKEVSDKREEELKIYKKERKAYLKLHPDCAAKLNGCTGKANQVHHKKGRVGKLFLDKKHWLGVCMNCHLKLEPNPNEAKEKGLSESRLKK